MDTSLSETSRTLDRSLRASGRLATATNTSLELDAIAHDAEPLHETDRPTGADRDTNLGLDMDPEVHFSASAGNGETID